MKIKTFTPKPPDSQRAVRRHIAIEKSHVKYQMLSCGHYTDYDTDVMFACWRLELGLGKLFHYCEVCQDWRKHAAKPRKPVFPDEPLF
jgi:hypothetical protein